MKLKYNDKENSLLDAAMELFIRYGYDKTTVNEIAKKAGISKGAVYLHFDSKQSIMGNLLFRETQKYNLRWFELIDADPKGGLMSGMYKNVLIALSASPIITASFCKDTAILGSYLKSVPQQGYGELIRPDFIKRLQDVDAVRKDINPSVMAHIMDMLAFAFSSIGDIKPSERIPKTDVVINAVADMMDRAFTPQDGGNSEAGKRVLHQIADEAIAYYERLTGQKFEKQY